MKHEQKITPKYWVGHDRLTDDVFISTMYKYRQDTYEHMQSIFGEDWEEANPNYDIILIELKEVIMKNG